MRRWQKALRITTMYVLCVTSVVYVLGILSSERSLHGNERRTIPVMSTVSPIKHVTDDGLVDTLLALPTQLPISRVQWSEPGVLSLDIRVASSIHHPRIIYEELYRWLHFSFYETDNVNRLELRVVIENKERRQKQILLALDTLRNQVTESDLNELVRNGHPPSIQAIRAMRLSYTTLWTEQFGVRAKL
ncbi:hypothetical protein [Paenibacillus agilis]|uniref:Uncharacterized protein n=1 Tax=Paenibacillus agilis TaxID=3020863 RepID=A0A559IZ29_9BACL|nr:hypothetical protein [Paenibacillus agilis]TVX92884.1 hypothetical protein FPZ44_07350 [Paenibacillus agilis]